MGVETLWWLGVAGAIAGWLVVLKLVLLVHRILGDIFALARMTRDAARSTAANLRAVSELPAVDRSSIELRDRIRELTTSLRALERTAERLFEGSVR